MKTISSIQELRDAEVDVDKFKDHYPNTYYRLLHLVNFTRQLQFKYEYLCGLIRGNDQYAEHFAPHFVQRSIIDLYKSEIEKIHKHPEGLAALEKVMDAHREIGYENFCLLVRGKTPEEIKGLYGIRRYV
ncbi:hypothetical protein ABNN70_04355 [Sporolactobacillus sp. Y61]|jgi:hypothetical protein|uniref:Uncharacterized protein n=1 Tax=Sporolactobacillus sp. Y61 TaxID=3160863 RepID=A0AAU8IHJ7_9BACL|nr:hypothetical protein [Sporolactobacillus sp. THM19-2]RYL94103.1 hypothetical protein EWH91_02855 [Sporolactobacillus sp. THM19-2]